MLRIELGDNMPGTRGRPKRSSEYLKTGVLSDRVTVDMGPLGEVLTGLRDELSAATQNNKDQGKLLSDQMKFTAAIGRLVYGYTDEDSGEKVKGMSEKLDNIYKGLGILTKLAGWSAGPVISASFLWISHLLGAHTEQLPGAVANGASAFWANLLSLHASATPTAVPTFYIGP
jgi:hypothetical protein